MLRTLWIHEDVQEDLEALKQRFPDSVEAKVRWSQLQLAIHGR
jgi:hypothetical protein